jgi:hypothetical protein
MPELLSICIPTFNRASYLRELLDGLVAELEQTAGAATRVRLYVSDNASTDSTPEVVASFSRRWPIAYHRHPKNIGADYNFAYMIAHAAGDYVWLLGDDELVADGFLAPLLDRLKSGEADLLILNGLGKERPENRLPKDPATFPSYAALVDHYSRFDPWQLVEHSLISALIFKRAVYDLEACRKTLVTKDRQYSHMHGLVEGLARHPGPVHFHQVPTIIIREQRAESGDLTFLEFRYLWSRYYRWLARRFNQPALLAYARKQFNWRTWCRLRFQELKHALGGPREIG